MKKTIRILVAVVLSITMIAGYWGQTIQAFAEESVDIKAVFYLLKRDKSHLKISGDPQYYINLGAGTITEGQALYNEVDKIESLIGNTPDYSKAELLENEDIAWHRIQYNTGTGRWWVYGSIVEKKPAVEEVEEPDLETPDVETPVPEMPDLETPVPEMPDVETPVPEMPDVETPAPEMPDVETPDVETPVLELPTAVEAPARYYLLKREKSTLTVSADPQYYINLGNGTVWDAENLYDNLDQISAKIGQVADFSGIEMAENETIAWHRIQYNAASKRWWVFGKIVQTSVPPPVVPPPVAPSPSTETINELIYRLITTGNAEVQDVLKYALTGTQLVDVYDDVCENEARIAFNSYTSLTYVQTVKDKKVATMQLVNVDDGFAERYQKMLAVIADIKSGIDDRMSEAEKLLFVHEYIVSRTYYSAKDDFARTAIGPLVFGYAVCMGYSDAVILLMDELGIETTYVSCDPMNHGWVMAKIDGEWYHLDPTWDRKKTATSFEVIHKFFLKTDYEFQTVLPTHYSWNKSLYVTYPKSTAKTYANWFVHSVEGMMYYWDGEWYYSYENDIVKSKIDGTNREVLVAGDTSTLKITSFNNGQFTYS